MKIAAVVPWQTGDHTLQYTRVIIAATLQGGGDWALMCSKFSIQQSVSGGGHLSQPVILTRLLRHGLVFNWSPDWVKATFSTSSQSITNQVSSGYLEEVLEWKLASQSTLQPISCFCFTPDIQAEAPHRILFSYQCTIRTWLSVLPTT